MEEAIFAASQGVVALISIGILQGAKEAGLPKRFVTLASILIGVVAGLLGAWGVDTISLSDGVLGGIIAGLSASGAYSGGKSIIEKE